MNRTTYRIATRQYDGGEYLPHDDVLMSASTAVTLAKAMSAENLTMVRAQDEHGEVVETFGDEVEFNRLSAIISKANAACVTPPLPRWRVVLDMGLQYQTAYVRAHNSIGAMNAAEALVKGRGVALYDHVTMAEDQNGPVDTLDAHVTRTAQAQRDAMHSRISMTTITIGTQRRDGKFPVTLVFPGQPNAFGGFYPSKVLRKVYTREQVVAAVNAYGDADQKRAFPNRDVVNVAVRETPQQALTRVINRRIAEGEQPIVEQRACPKFEEGCANPGCAGAGCCLAID